VSDNLAPAFTGFRTLSKAQIVSLAGADAVAFAQAQFANDVPSLADGHWQWSAWLTAKGRVLSIFQLVRVDAQTLLLVCHDGGAEAMAEQLRRFVFRRKVVIGHANALAVNAALETPGQARGAQIAQLADGVIELDVGSATVPRTLQISSAASSVDDTTAELAWRQYDLRFGLPRLEDAQREQWTPQQLGLDRLNAYSVKKGCYPGQEIVARTHFLGKAKRSLALLECASFANSGDAVQHGDSNIGSVACVAGALALAVLPLELPEGPLLVNGEIASIQPLLEGLAR
jgi:folate-binding protein YgfZ